MAMGLVLSLRRLRRANERLSSAASGVIMLVVPASAKLLANPERGKVGGVGGGDAG